MYPEKICNVPSFSFANVGEGDFFLFSEKNILLKCDVNADMIFFVEGKKKSSIKLVNYSNQSKELEFDELITNSDFWHYLKKPTF